MSTSAISATLNGSDFNRLLCKFPVFDLSWPDEIKAKWFATFGELREIAVTLDAATFEEINYPEWH